jgi:hypothetical protein
MGYKYRVLLFLRLESIYYNWINVKKHFANNHKFVKLIAYSNYKALPSNWIETKIKMPLSQNEKWVTIFNWIQSVSVLLKSLEHFAPMNIS